MVDKFCGKPVWKTLRSKSDWGKLKNFQCVKNGERGFPQNSEKFLWKTRWKIHIVNSVFPHKDMILKERSLAWVL